MSAEVEAQLRRMSPATIDWMLKPRRRLGGRRLFSTTKPASLLKSAIPIRIFAEWKESRPGFLEGDLLPHCGDSAEGFYLNTLSTMNVTTRWSEFIGLWGRGQERVGNAIHKVRRRLPFPLMGLTQIAATNLVKNDLILRKKCS